MPKIEIIAIGMNKIYSVGRIHVSKKGDVYHAYKHKNDYGFHMSRHRDGTIHWKSKTEKIPIRKTVDIENFSGVEYLGTQGFGLESLPELFNEYQIKKSDGIFAIDMRNYKESSFNLCIAIFTDEGLEKLYKAYKDYKKRQIYFYMDCHPKIAIIALDAKKD